MLILIRLLLLLIALSSEMWKRLFYICACWKKIISLTATTLLALIIIPISPTISRSEGIGIDRDLATFRCLFLPFVAWWKFNLLIVIRHFIEIVPTSSVHGRVDPRRESTPSSKHHSDLLFEFFNLRIILVVCTTVYLIDNIMTIKSIHSILILLQMLRPFLIILT
jgi:hypothetical protein